MALVGAILSSESADNWTSYSPTRGASAGTWSGGSVTASYTLFRKVLTVRWYITGTDVSNANVNLTMTLPSGMTAAVLAAVPCIQQNAGAAYATSGVADIQAASGTITFTINYANTFGIAVANTSVIGQMALEIQ